jgi:hypothetical protein
MRSILPFCVKKYRDLQIAISYFEDKLTGDEAISLLEQQRLSGRRRGVRHSASMPYTRSEGLRAYQLVNAARARDAHRVPVAWSVKSNIKEDRENGLSIHKLQEKYGYTQGVIRRVIREPLGPD